MDLIFLLPLMETLLFNVVALNFCFKKKYSSFKTVLIFCAFALIFFLPWDIFRKDMSSGDGRFAAIGLSYVFLLKFLYDEKLPRLFLGMCMTWVYTQGIISLSTQIVGFFAPEHPEIFLVLFETAALLLFLIPFRKYIIPKYLFIFRYMHDFKKAEFRHLAITVYLNLVMLFLFHGIFLEGKASLQKIAVLLFFLAANYFFYSIIYEVISNTVKIHELESTTLHDHLTGLGNRRQLMKHLNTLLEEEQTFSVMFLDLDRFKQINDRYGHETGDKYLIHFGRVCSKELGEKGTLYRYGGDEFVIIYYGVLTDAMAGSITECRLWHRGAPCEFNQVSMGYVVCTPPFGHVSPIDLLKQADGIMYQNKLKRAAN